MTTGVEGPLSVTTGDRFYRAWSGADGRSTWNPYDVKIIEENVPLDQYGSPFSIGFEPDSTDNNTFLRALSRLGSSVKHHEFNLAVAAAETPLAVKMILDNLRTLRAAVRDVKRGNLSKAVSDMYYQYQENTKELSKRRKSTGLPLPRTPPPRLKPLGKSLPKQYSDRVLEIQYGWKPLLNDCYQLMTALNHYYGKPRLQRYTSSATHRRLYTDGNFRYFLSTHFHNSVKIIFEQKEIMDPTRELGLTDPLSVAWELTPFSFVADWFIPIGTYLEAINTIPHLEGRFLVMNRARSVTTYNRFDGGFRKSEGYSTVIRFTRQVPSSLPVPLPTFKSLDSSFSPVHIFNAIHLLLSSITH